MMLKYFGQWMLAVTLMFAAAAQAQDQNQDQAPAGAERPPLEEMPHAFQIAFWLNQAALAFDDQDYEDWARATERLHALRPYNQDFMTHLVRAYARQEKFSEAYNMMLMMQQQGLAEDWSQYPELEPMHEHRLYQHLADLMNKAFEPFGDASTFSTLDDISMPEALAHDSENGRFFLGTVREGRILTSTDGESWEVFAGPETHQELMAVMDIAIDQERGHLWVATAALTQFRQFRTADKGRTALLKLDLDSGELLSSHRLIPDRNPHVFGALAISPSGTVFAADTATPMIYKLGPDETHPQPFFGHPNFASIRGIVLSEDASKLYMSDYEVGIFVVNTDDPTKAWKLAVPENLNEGGIDGLYLWNDHLVGIQNGISPQRVVRLKLGDDGLGVVEVAPLVAAQSGFDTPTFGTMVDNELIFLAGSHWHHVDSRGRRTGTRLPDIALMRTEVDSAKVLGVGQDMLEELMQRAEQQRNATPPPDNG